jgi:hypothetical protein
LELDYQGHFQSTRSARNPTTILQSDLLGFGTPVTKMEILVTGPVTKYITLTIIRLPNRAYLDQLVKSSIRRGYVDPCGT